VYVSQRWKYLAFKAGDHVVGVALNPLAFVEFVPLAGDCLECVCREMRYGALSRSPTTMHGKVRSRETATVMHTPGIG
jgi:hypothetical protein